MTTPATIDSADLRTLMSSAAPPRVLDVRTPGEFDTVHMPGAKWVAFAVGAGLAFAALTNTCAMGMLLARLPYNRGATCDLSTVVALLVDTAETKARGLP